MRLSTLLALVALSLLALPRAQAQTYPSTGGPFPVPDGPAANTAGAPLTNTITVAEAGAIGDLDVQVNITHTWVGDLVVRLAKGATTVGLANRPGLGNPNPGGCGTANMNVIFDDEGTAGAIDVACTAGAYTTGGRYTPTQALTGFDGQDRAGDWTLTVIDNWVGDTGSLVSWSLVVSGSTANEGTPLPAGYAFDLAGANPATSSTQFNLAVAETQDVRVVLYDALGREVSEVFARTLAAGQTAFVGVNVSALSPGLYIARATGAGFVASQTFSVAR
jgi:subtilisin-like proprotein convertase family protein